MSLFSQLPTSAPRIVPPTPFKGVTVPAAPASPMRAGEGQSAPVPMSLLSQVSVTSQ